jgi:hypothetical protein
VVVHLTDCPTVGEPGSPALPSRVTFPAVAKIPRSRVRSLEMTRARWAPRAQVF